LKIKYLRDSTLIRKIDRDRREPAQYVQGFFSECFEGSLP